MKVLIYLIFIILSPLIAAIAQAQVISVQSGEHGSFTRLALVLGAPTDWKLGRTSDGYELWIDRPAARYDLSQVYRQIARDRLAAIWVDPQSGTLRLGIGCACSAMPFEFRPGVIIIDLRDGPPPPGSSFETALAGEPLPQLVQQGRIRPRARPQSSATRYDWQSSLALNPSVSISSAPALPLDRSRLDLAPMRDTLLLQLSQGAARGVVDLTLPPKGGASLPGPTESTGGSNRQLRIGEDLGFVGGNLRQFPETATGSGAVCLDDSVLDISSWGQNLPVAEQMGPALSGITGEFDRPVPDAVIRAVRFYLFLGFGAEARQLLAFAPADSKDVSIWQSIAAILDGGIVTDGPFEGMQACDTAAALWSVLAHPNLSASDFSNKKSILRGFSALPLHLRRHLGPALMERFMTVGDTKSARAVHDAIVRAPGDSGPQVRIMGAKLDLALGNIESADRALTAAANEGGPGTADALIARVDAQISQGKPVDPLTVTELAALALENRGSELEPKLQRTHLLALAASGDIDAAFNQRATAPDAEPDLWRILADQGPDSALLTHAVLADAAPVPAVPLVVRRKLAERLIGLGFAGPALRWIPDVMAANGKASDGDRLLAAQARILVGDANAALDLAAGMRGPDAGKLRATAQVGLGDMTGAASQFSAIGDAASALRMARLAHQWPLVLDKGQDPWRAAAGLVVNLTGGAGPMPILAGGNIPGPLARGHAAVAESAAARATLMALLSQTVVTVP